MDDDEVIFENSALHQHLKSVGYMDEDVDPEQQVMEIPGHRTADSEHADSHTQQGTDNPYLTKLTFWSKLKNSINEAFWNESWNDQLTQVHNKYADELTDAILQNPVLEEEDGTYIESFYTSMQSYRPENTQGEASIMGVMLMQMAILSVSLAYAGFRMIYLKSPDITSRYYVWSIDVIAVLLTIAVLTPTTVRSASAGKALGRLKEFSRTAHGFLNEVHTFYLLSKRCVKLVQEMELVVRGFTIISPLTPVSRLEQGRLQTSRRQCPKLRRLTFHAARSLMLNVKRAAQNLLKSFPPHVEIDGLSSYLANQPLHQYGPCVYTSGENTEDKLRAVTDDYSLASLKAMVELCNIHMSEFLRIIAMSCLTQAEEHDKNPSYKIQKQVLTTLKSKFVDQLKPLTKLYTLHKSLNSARERKEREVTQRSPREQSPSQSLYIAVHSLLLHLKSALGRIENVEDELEKVVDSEDQKSDRGDGLSSVTPSEQLLARLTSDLKVIRSELSACQDCLEEGEMRVEKLKPGSIPKNPPQTNVSSPAEDGSTKPTSPPVPLFEMGDPVVVDEVFQAYTDDVEIEPSTLDADSLLSDEEREKKKQERREAVRLLKELRTVIAIRAEDHEERERQALLRQYPDAKFEDPIESLRKQKSQPQSLHEQQSNLEQIDEEQESLTCELSTARAVPQSLPKIEIDGNLRDKLAGLGGNFSFSMDVAAQAAARSHQMAAYSEDTFGDDDSPEELSDAGPDDVENIGAAEVNQAETGTQSDEDEAAELADYYREQVEE